MDKEKIYIGGGNSASGANTVLLVVLLLIVVGVVVWWFAIRGGRAADPTPANDQASFDINVTLPDRSGASADGEGGAME